MRRGRTLPSSLEHATIKYQQRPKRVLEETHWTTLHFEHLRASRAPCRLPRQHDGRQI